MTSPCSAFSEFFNRKGGCTKMDMYDARYEVLTMVLLMIQAFWNAIYSLSWVNSL
jgi:hypothetical protein